MVHDGEERERFGSLSIAYMSDESSVDETGTIPPFLNKTGHF